MSHTEECMRNFDENCHECKEWKIYQQELDERRNFLTKFWESRKEHHIPHESNVTPRLKPTSNETRTIKCAFCPELFKEDAMKIHLDWFHPFHETNAMENTSMPESQMESRTELQISSESGVNPRLKQTMNKTKIWACALCTRYYPRKDKLKKHVELMHEKKKPLRCEMNEANTTNEVKENISIDEEDISMSEKEVRMTKENISLNEENTSVNVEITSVNVQNTSVNVENTSVNEENTSVNEENTSVNEENTSLNEEERNDSTNENTSMTEENTLINENTSSEYHIFSVRKKKLLKSETCDVICPTMRELKKHVELVMKPIKCGLCDFNCIKIEAIRQHFESAHEVKEHSCNICGYRCDRKDAMKEHMKLNHSIKKPFPCNFCDFRCSRKDNLKVHVQGKHHLKKQIRT